MYYRVAIQGDSSTLWVWKSTVLSSLNTVLQFLRLYRALPPDRLRVFSSCSPEGLAEQLEQENQGLASTSLTAAQLLSERMSLPSTVQSTAAREGGMSLEKGSGAVSSQQAVNERSWEGSGRESRGMRVLERRREALESGPGCDHDLPYRFNLPLSLPQVLAWVRLLTKVKHGEGEVFHQRRNRS
jgi:hypothetical protein